MKRLYILRHGKSSWAQPGTGDIDRPLNERGVRQVLQLHDWFKGQAQKPDKILCSPSVRTRQTLSELGDSVGGANIEYVAELYNGTTTSYLQHLWIQSAECVLIVGHNPICDELARYLTTPSSPASDKLMANHFGTACMAIFDIKKTQWSELGEADGSLVDFIRPKDLSL